MLVDMRHLSRVSFVRSPILFMRILPLGPNHIPKAPPPDTITLALGLNLRIWVVVGDDTKHSVYSTILRRTIEST